jgi:hypothetical protein
MNSKDLDHYLEVLAAQSHVEPYITRRFSAVTNEGGTEQELGYGFRGVSREKEPELEELLKHPRLVILGEPGAGKSLVARAAIREIISKGERIPIFSELKQYRNNLGELLRKSAPEGLLVPGVLIENNTINRTYVFDGVDEIPLETLGRFWLDLEALVNNDNQASVLITARQAFYVINRNSMPQFNLAFQILEFSDDDILEYASKLIPNPEAFVAAARLADADDEIRNPFVLSVTIDRFRQVGDFRSLRSDNLAYIVDRLIQSRPLVNQHRQRRALCMLAVAMETYCRNELTEEEALRIIKQSMSISHSGAEEILRELYGSIIRPTANGFAFQMRSYGEYLAAEALEGESLDRLKELAFQDFDTPNDSWMNTISYLVELNPAIRTFFVTGFPFWMISSSPSAFSENEKERIVGKIFDVLIAENHFINTYPRINMRRIGRYLTPTLEAELFRELSSPNDVTCGNALVLLGVRRNLKILPVGFAILQNKALDTSFRFCGLLALLNSGNPELIPELIPLLDPDDSLEINILDLIGALCDESQIPAVLPLMLDAGAMLSNAFYRFREFRSRDALLQVLRYFVNAPQDLNEIRADGYVGPILKTLPQYWDADIAEICSQIILSIQESKIYPDRSGVVGELFNIVRKADVNGTVATLFLQRFVGEGKEEKVRAFYVDELVASLMTIETAQWLTENRATHIIEHLSPYVRGPVRDVLRPFSNGLIDTQETNAKFYETERAGKEKSYNQKIHQLQIKVLLEKTINEALRDFFELSEDHWPELPLDYKQWFEVEISRLMTELDLGNSVEWKNGALHSPGILSWILKLINRYELKIEPDLPLVFAATAWDEKVVADYYRRFGLSAEAQELVCKILINPKSPRAQSGIVGFLRDSGLWSSTIETGLIKIVRDRTQEFWQLDALAMLVQHDIGIAFLEEIASNGASDDLKQAAFESLVNFQHRATIERGLSSLLNDDEKLKLGELGSPISTRYGWIGKIRAEFAVKKLAQLRESALRLQLIAVAGLVTETLIKIDRAKAARIIRRQISVAPPTWRQAQQSIALDQERAVRIEKAQSTPFDVVLRKLKGATSLQQLKLVCEGSTDLPVFKALLAQIPDLPEILFDFVGGWSALCAKDPYSFQHGCKEAMLVMDGDLGRHLQKKMKPLTKMAREQQTRLAGFPVELRILERYGIENYFPQSCLESVLRRDLTSYFPVPDDVSVPEYLRESDLSWSSRLKRFLVFRLHIPIKLTGLKIYSKGQNGEVAKRISLDKDLMGTDIFETIQLIALKAKSLTEV